MKRIMVLILALMVLISLPAGAMLLDYEAEFGDIDFEGETVSYVMFYDHFEEFKEGGEYAGRLEEAKEKFNIGDIEYLHVAWGDTQDLMMSRLLSGESNYDMWMLPHRDVWPLITQGAFYPINEILPEEYFANMPSDVRGITETLSYDGEIYHTGLGEDHYMTIVYLLWNKDIFDREGLTPLDELYREGNLTWDEIENIAGQATRDTTGDGEIDQWGLGDFDALSWISSNDVFPTAVDEDGYRYFNYDSEEALYALNRLKGWDEEGYFGASWERQEFRDGYIAMEIHEIWQFEETMQELEDDWGAVPMPRGPHADEHVFFANNLDGFYVPANADYPEGMIALHNFLYPASEYQDEQREDYRLENSPDQLTYEVMARAEDEWAGEAFVLQGVLGDWWDDANPFGQAMGGILWGGEDPGPAMDAAAPAIQAQIDDMFDQ